MQRLRMVIGVGLVALVLSAGLVPIPGANVSGTAYAGGSYATDPSSGDGNPQAGDPDGPTGDVAPPTKGTINDPVSVGSTPAKPVSLWARFYDAFKLYLRFRFSH